MWGCREHWFKLPKPLRDQVWREYRPGQEITKTPSVRYLAVAALVQGWIAGKVTINKDGSIFVHEDLQVIAKRARESLAEVDRLLREQEEGRSDE